MKNQWAIFSKVNKLTTSERSNLEQLRQAITDFIAAYGPTAKPFVWRKREVKGSQLRNTIVNLRN